MKLIFCIAALLILPQTARGDDWPQWLGPNRDGVWRETGIVRSFAAGGPRLRWRSQISSGYSGPAVVEGRVFVTDRVAKGQDPTTEQKDHYARRRGPGAERVLCLDESDGAILWKHEYDCPYSIAYPAGPRATPTVHRCIMISLDVSRPAATVVWRQGQDRGVAGAINTPFLEDGYIYASGHDGLYRCVELETGRRIWETYAPTTTVRKNRWANAFTVKNGDRFFLANDEGDLIIAKLTPAGYGEIGRCRILEPTGRVEGRDLVWSHPAFANKSIYARNDKEIVCMSLALESGSKD